MSDRKEQERSKTKAREYILGSADFLFLPSFIFIFSNILSPSFFF